MEEKYTQRAKRYLKNQLRELEHLMALREQAFIAMRARAQVEEFLRRETSVTSDSGTMEKYVQELNRRIGGILPLEVLRTSTEIDALPTTEEEEEEE